MSIIKQVNYQIWERYSLTQSQIFLLKFLYEEYLESVLCFMPVHCVMWISHVVVQFYFPLFYPHNHTLPYSKTTDNKNWTVNKLEPQHIYKKYKYKWDINRKQYKWEMHVWTHDATLCVQFLNHCVCPPLRLLRTLCPSCFWAIILGACVWGEGWDWEHESFGQTKAHNNIHPFIFFI